MFLGCTEQRFEDGYWSGSSIDYRKQAALSKRLDSTMRSIAHFLWSRGYYGPVGADVTEDRAGTQWIIDLNVRTPSSLILTLLRCHFYVERGFHIARLLPDLRPCVSRDELEAALQTEWLQALLSLLPGWTTTSGSRIASQASLLLLASLRSLTNFQLELKPSAAVRCNRATCTHAYIELTCIHVTQ